MVENSPYLNDTMLNDYARVKLIFFLYMYAQHVKKNLKFV